MKIFLRMLAFVVLMLVALMTFARQDDSVGWIVFTSIQGVDSAIFLMTDDGRAVRKITPNDACGNRPQWSPNGRWIVFHDCTEEADLMRIRLMGLQMEPLTKPPFETWHFLWSPNSEQIMVQTYEPLELFIIGIDQSNERFLARDYLANAWSPDGTWIYARSSRSFEAALVRIHAESGLIEDLLPSELSLGSISWSPDGERIVMNGRINDHDQLYVAPSQGGQYQEIAIHPPMFRIQHPQWSPTGEWIAFTGTYEVGDDFFRKMHVYRIRPDGSDLQRLTHQAATLSDLQWSPDGEWLLFASGSRGDLEPGIFRMRPDGSRLENLTPNSALEYEPYYGQLPDLYWHPEMLIFCSLVIFAASVISSKVWRAFF
jgi:Tol biopolymer transport system component